MKIKFFLILSLLIGLNTALLHAQSHLDWNDLSDSTSISGQITFESLLDPERNHENICLLESMTTEPIDFVFKTDKYTSPSPRYKSGGMAFKAYNRLSQAVEGEVEFYVLGKSSRRLKTHYKGVSEENEQQEKKLQFFSKRCNKMTFSCVIEIDNNKTNYEETSYYRPSLSDGGSNFGSRDKAKFSLHASEE